MTWGKDIPFTFPALAQILYVKWRKEILLKSFQESTSNVSEQNQQTLFNLDLPKAD